MSLKQRQQESFMRAALALARESVRNGGGPFGAVIVKNGEIVAAASNSVTLTNDPTAHAEVNAIRQACHALNTFDLSGCTLFTSCEPCPMCLGAIYWARLDAIYYGNSKRDAARIGFDDAFIYEQLAFQPEDRAIPMINLLPEEAGHAFTDWEQLENKTEY
ncbi:nucleoside deaminase [Desulfonatronum thioautotrophicum]|uniref:nucleoside deaminase n=1 Tax=Desulfonatronum thioautotrophicum TaxID=617001 RepID=UPI000AAADAFB|nr:nucleoside deaminase [Desulfonatronum thioautotrophicum]